MTMKKPMTENEYKQLKKVILHPVIENDPKYGWWTLAKGIFIVKYNEFLISDDYIATVFPHNRLLMTGAYHPTFIIKPQEEIYGILINPNKSLRMKENARISTALTQKAIIH